MTTKAAKPKLVIKTSRQGDENPLLTQLYKDGETYHVELSRVRRDENQPRSFASVMENIEEFAEDIRLNGIIQPPLYRIMDDGSYQIVVGERRTEGAKFLGWETILARCKKFTTPDEIRSLYEIQYAENDVKNNKALKPLEDAIWWRNYIANFNDGKVELAAKRRNVSISFISQKLSMLKASSEILGFIEKNLNDFSTAYHLVGLEEQNSAVAREWMDDFIAGKVANVRGSLTEIKRKIKDVKKSEKADLKKAKSRPIKHDLPELAAPIVQNDPIKSELPAPINKMEAVENAGLNDTLSKTTPLRPINKTVVPAQGTAKFRLNEHLLLSAVARDDFAGRYLGHAFLSVSQKTPFTQSLGDLTLLGNSAYQMFFQILDISEDREKHKSKIEQIEKKITHLLSIK